MEGYSIPVLNEREKVLFNTICRNKDDFDLIKSQST